MPRKSPSVVLVGRPNVGKSTLFNRMTGSRRAIVAPIAGTTRDALARPVVWRGVVVPAVRYRRVVRRERGSAARAGRPAGTAGDRRRRSAGAAGRRTRGADSRRRADRPRTARDRPPGPARDQQDRRQAVAEVGDGVLPARLRPGHRDFRGARDRRGGTARRDRRRGWRPEQAQAPRAQALRAPTRMHSQRRALSPEPRALQWPTTRPASRSSAGPTSASRRS